jgi:hypothetical protein
VADARTNGLAATGLIRAIIGLAGHEARSLKDALHIMERIGSAGAGFRSITEKIDTTTPAGRIYDADGRGLR